MKLALGTFGVVAVLWTTFGGRAWAQAEALPPQVIAPSLRRSFVVHETDFTIAGVEFLLHSGSMALSATTPSQPGAAVFIGAGEVRMQPPNAIEQQQLELFSGKATLDEVFKTAVFRFIGNQFAGDQERWGGAGKSGAQDRPPDPAFERLLQADGHRMEADGWIEPVRLLQASANAELQPEAANLLYVELTRRDGTTLEVEVDPMRAEPVHIHARARQPERFLNQDGNQIAQQARIEMGFDDTWVDASVAGTPPLPANWNMERYDIDSVLPGDRRLGVTENLSLQCLTATHGILLTLDSKFRMDAATAGGVPLRWLQAPDPNKLEAAAGYEGNWLYLELPQAASAGQTIQLSLRATDHGFFVTGASMQLQIALFPNLAWYPLPSFGAPLQRSQFTFDITFPARISGIHASGNPVALTPAAPPGTKQSRAAWATTEPQTAFGFLPGAGRKWGTRVLTLGDGKQVALVTEDVPQTNIEKVRDEMAATLEFYSAEFGDYPFTRLEESEQNTTPPYDPVTGSQLYRAAAWLSNIPARLAVPGRMVASPGRDMLSWPQLMILDDRLPVLGFTQPTGPVSQRQWGEVLAPHVVAHQWWNHWVGWATYHDQWLAEGLANGSAVLFDEAHFGREQAALTLEAWRNELTTKDASGHIPDTLGPIWLGQRLDSSLDPQGFETVVYDKGGYVLEMLAAMMRQPEAQAPDAAFIAMMHDYMATYGGRNPTTADFQAMIEKHMLPALDLDHKHSMQWFFDEYVYKTGVPTLEVHAETKLGASGGHDVTVRIANPSGWRGMVPVEIVQDRQHSLRRWITVDGPQVTATFEVDFAPVEVAANRYNEMLVRVHSE